MLRSDFLRPPSVPYGAFDANGTGRRRGACRALTDPTIGRRRIEHELQGDYASTVSPPKRAAALDDAVLAFLRHDGKPKAPAVGGGLWWARLALDAYRSTNTAQPGAASGQVVILRADVALRGDACESEPNRGSSAFLVQSGRMARRTTRGHMGRLHPEV